MPESAAMKLEVDIVSDVVCPWCIIGYRQLQKALDMMPGQFEVDIRWHPFELNPGMPQEGQDVGEHLAQKYGTSPEQSQAARSRLTSLGDSLGFKFDYSPGMRMVNTFRAHQLLHWAGEQGLQTPLKLALFEAFFSNREDVSDADVLVKVAQNVGLSGEQARELISSRCYETDVRKEQQYWLDQDVHGVPAFVFNNKHMVPGAQEADTFVRILNKIGAQQAA
ncbi:MAG: DsbA family oxidoreductase [Halioglobus sp.]